MCRFSSFHFQKAEKNLKISQFSFKKAKFSSSYKKVIYVTREKFVFTRLDSKNLWKRSFHRFYENFALNSYKFLWRNKNVKRFLSPNNEDFYTPKEWENFDLKFLTRVNLFSMKGKRKIIGTNLRCWYVNIVCGLKLEMTLF